MKEIGPVAAIKTVNNLLREHPHRWVVTGVAGFIGSHLLEELLSLNQFVVGIDNFSTGGLHNLEEVRRAVSPEQWQKFEFREIDLLPGWSVKELAMVWISFCTKRLWGLYPEVLKTR